MDKQDKPLSEWTLGEAIAMCKKRTSVEDSDVKERCVGCPLNGKTCDVSVDGSAIILSLPNGWNIGGGDGAKPERRADPEPSPTGEACGDNRFKLIEKYKKKLVDSTNIETAKDEMAVIDNILFRFWQVGWLDALEAATTSAPDMGDRASTRPRLAEVLGVEIGERFRVDMGYARTDEFYIGPTGDIRCESGDGRTIYASYLCNAINHPERIVRAPRLTEPEIAIMRAVGAKWVSRDKYADQVDLWSQEPVNKYNSGVYIWGPEAKSGYIGEVRASLFPSVRPVECIGLEETE